MGPRHKIAARLLRAGIKPARHLPLREQVVVRWLARGRRFWQRRRRFAWR